MSPCSAKAEPSTGVSVFLGGGISNKGEEVKPIAATFAALHNGHEIETISVMDVRSATSSNSPSKAEHRSWELPRRTDLIDIDAYLYMQI